MTDTTQRRLAVACLMSLDGVVEDPQSWAAPYFDEEAVAASLAALQRADAMLMGRGTYEYFAPAWSGGEGPYLGHIDAMPKHVLSASLDTVDWRGAQLVAEDGVEAVRRLKHEGGGDLVLYGFGRLARSLLDAGLVDELAVAVHPVLVGAGGRVALREPRTALRLTGSERRRSGVVTLRYARD
jgi:dihydrofolate reductase